MAATYEPMSVPRTDPTARDAIDRAVRDEPGRLHATIGERCGDALIEAFHRMARAYYGRQS